MWRPDAAGLIRDRASLRDIEALNRLFSDAFTDRYHRDGMTGVRVPFLSPEIWRYAIEDAGAGAMLWRDPSGELVGFNMLHLSGAEGWMGPLAVRPARQGQGVGERIVREGVEWLLTHGATRVGLETMPRTIDNIGFYSRLGFLPGHLTITLVREPVTPGGPVGTLLGDGALEPALAACRALTVRLAPGTDFTRELVLTEELGLGGTTLLAGPEGLRGFALWHRTPLAQGRAEDEVRVLKLVAEGLAAVRELLDQVGARAAQESPTRRVAVRCQTRYQDLYAMLIAEGFAPHWTDLRMHWREVPPAVPGVVLSNWEI